MSHEDRPWIGLAVAASVAGGGIYSASQGGRGIDLIQDAARHVGFLSPGSVLITFRAAEWLSPLTSVLRQELQPGTSVKDGGEVFARTWDDTSTPETFRYLEKILGKETLDGLTPGDFRLRFERKRGAGAGELFLDSGEGWKSVGEGFRLFEAQEVRSDFLETTRSGRVNPAFHSILANLGLDVSRERATGILRTGEEEFSRYIPVPDFLSGSRPALDRLKMVTAPLTFGLQRFNRGLQLVSEHGLSKLEKAVGVTLASKSGPAWELLTRYGLKSGLVVGAGVALAQVDWARREFSFPGELFASGAVSLGVAHLAQRLGKSGKFSLLAGGASFLGQLVLPGFDQGVPQGLATTAVGLDVVRAAVGKVTFNNMYRRVVEGFLPGFTSWQTSVVAGVAAVGAGTLFGKHLVGATGLDFLPGPLQGRIGVISAQVTGDTFLPSAKARYWEEMLGPGGFSLGRLYQRFKSAWASPDRAEAFATLGDDSFLAWQKSVEQYRDAVDRHPLNESLRTRLEQINARYDESFLGKIGRSIEAGATSLVHAIAGHPLEGSGYRETLKGLNYKPKLGKLGLMFTAGALTHALLSGGLLGSLQDPSELVEIYSGERYVEVKKNRWWLLGAGEFEGSETSYLRPSAYAMFMARTNEKVIWGGREDEISPFGKIFRQNFTYSLERNLAYERPNTITAPAFANFPIIGDLLAGTIGRFVKPTKLIRPGEWISLDEDGNRIYALPFEFNAPVYELGGIKPGDPVSPYGGGQILANLSYRGRELEGLTGFAKNQLSEFTIGSAAYGTDDPILSSYADVTSLSTAYWRANLGDLFGTTELVRRVVPNKRGGNEYNPLRNSMPAWLPEYLSVGDPYSRIKDGAVRLPGPGYASIHKEVSGLDPDDYPILHQYAILADVAPSSFEFSITRKKVLSSSLTEEQIAFVNRVEERIARRRNQFGKVHENAIQLPGSSATQYVWSAFQKSLREWLSPIEYLSPFPGQPLKKFFNNRGAIEDYEFRNLYGSATSMWDKPFRDWVRPAFYSTLHNFGWDGKPGWREEADEIQEYFDVLEYTKWMRLADSAPNKRDRDKFLKQASRTRFGVNVRSNPYAALKTLPKSQQRYFHDFATTTDEGDRERIIEMVPKDIARIYQQIWEILDKGGSLDPYLETEVDPAYLYSRAADAAAFLDGKPLPPPTWVGFDQRVDIDDIKLKYLERIGADIYAYDLWGSQQEMLHRKPYLEGAEDFMFSSGTPRGEILRSLIELGQDPVESSVIRTDSQMGSFARIYYDDNREAEIRSYLNGIQQ